MRQCVISFICLGFLLACESKKEFDFWGTYQKVISSEGELVEWHGEPQNVEALDSLSILEKGNCQGPGCETALFLSNTSSRKIKALVQAPFQMDDFQGHFATLYEIDAHSQLDMGCSHLCRGEEKIYFERRIVGAEYFP